MSPTPGLSAVTLLSLFHFCVTLLWASAIFISICGYGAALIRSFGMRRPSLTLAAATGFAPALLIGGVLNLGHLIYSPVLITFVLAGLIPAAALLRPATGPISDRKEPVNLATRVVCIAVVLVCGLRIASSVHDSVYEISDDFNYYLAVPKKMIETHSFAAEPYSERRVMSSVGGNEFLQALMLSAQPLETIQIVEWGFGALLLLLFALALGDEFELDAVEKYLLALFFLITPQIRLNLTFSIVPSALFVGMVYTAAHRRLTAEWPVLQAVALGAMVAAMTAMKSTYISHAVLLVLCFALLRWWKRGFLSGARLFGIAAAIAFFTLLPWMIANHAASGTYFYPILGKGIHYSAYGLYPPPTSFNAKLILTKVVPFTAPLFLLCVIEFFITEADERSYAVVALSVTALAATLLNGVVTGGDSIRRFNYPCILPAITLLFLLAARRRVAAPRASAWRWIEGLAAMVAVASAINVGLSHFTDEYKHTWLCLRASLADYHAAPLPLVDEYARLERAIPSDGTALTTLNAPFLLNFSRHSLYLADFPGDASPKPGWPARQPGEALARFLVAHQVKYLIYSYEDCYLEHGFKTCADQRADDYRFGMTSPNVSQWIKTEKIAGHDAELQYEQIGRQHPRIYDDGKIFIVDLTSPMKP